MRIYLVHWTDGYESEAIYGVYRDISLAKKYIDKRSNDIKYYSIEVWESNTEEPLEIIPYGEQIEASRRKRDISDIANSCLG